jgi:hypothetical protein
MTAQQIVAMGRKILPLLDGLLGAQADEVRTMLNRLLAEAAKKGAKGVADKILELLSKYAPLRKWMRETGAVKSSTKSAPPMPPIPTPVQDSAFKEAIVIPSVAPDPGRWRCAGHAP